eukprot:2013030-Ditylum_brightwellii.AAC.1
MDLSSTKTTDLLAKIQRQVECANTPTHCTVFIDPPGCGKGTQAPVIKNKCCLCHLATGDLLWTAVREGTEMGEKGKKGMNEGKLVMNDIVVEIIHDAMRKPECKNGFILYGFMRT